MLIEGSYKQLFFQEPIHCYRKTVRNYERGRKGVMELLVKCISTQQAENTITQEKFIALLASKTDVRSYQNM